MRLIKTAEEIEFMQRAADIAAEAHRRSDEGRAARHEGIRDRGPDRIHLPAAGAAGPAYTSIVGGGGNATILHYIENKAELRDGDLLLDRRGRGYEGYASDITRTFPVNGRFTEAQRDIYDLVLESQVACIEMVQPRRQARRDSKRSVEMLTEGMVRLGLLKGDPKTNRGGKVQAVLHAQPRTLSRDRRARRGSVPPQRRIATAEAGMVMTIEPGLYVAEDPKTSPNNT